MTLSTHQTRALEIIRDTGYFWPRSANEASTARSLERRRLATPETRRIPRPGTPERMITVTVYVKAIPSVSEIPSGTKFLLHRLHEAEYVRLDSAARARGCRYYHAVRIRGAATTAGNDSGSGQQSIQQRMCCDEELEAAIK